MDQILAADLEWINELLDQMKICQTEINTLNGFLTGKLQNKYKIAQGDQVDFKTGVITRAQQPAGPQLVKDNETKENNQTT